MTEVVVHEMKYFGGKVDSDLELVNYKNENYDDYRRICCDSFKNLSIATNQDNDKFYTPEEMEVRKDTIYILFSDEEIIGSVEIHENVIDHLFVDPKHQNKGYGKKLLFYAINYLQEKNVEEIVLFVADLSQNAVKLYLDNGFKCVNTIVDNWS